MASRPKTSERKRFNANTVVAVAALVTSVVAVLVAWDESRLLRKSQAASFMPILETRSSLVTADDDLRITLTIRNTGHGVGYIENAQILFDEEPITDFREFASSVLNEDLGRTADFSWAGMRGFLQAGESKDIISLSWEDTPENRTMVENYIRHEAASKQDGFELRLCYCSVFDECWVRTDDDTSRPQRIDSCPATGNDPSAALWASYVAMQEEAR